MPRRRPLLVPGLLLALCLAVTGCGSEDDPPAKGPGKEATACREQWRDLAQKTSGREEKTNPSALAQRWNTISATISHYATSARGSDCGDTLDDVDKAIAALTTLGSRLAAYDMELRLQQVESGAEEYAAAPRPPAPEPSPAPKAKKGKKAKKVKPAPRPPKPAEIARALKTLTAQAPLATEQQEAGWQQARAVDLDDAKAVTKAVRDLAFLSTQSPAYRASTAALIRIRGALEAAGS